MRYNNFLTMAMPIELDFGNIFLQFLMQQIVQQSLMCRQDVDVANLTGRFAQAHRCVLRFPCLDAGTVRDWRQFDALSDIECTDAFGRMGLVAGNREQIYAKLLHVDRNLSHRLSGIHVLRNDPPPHTPDTRLRE